MNTIETRAFALSIDVPEPVLAVMHELHNAGYEAFIVGGCVRDALLGREPHDWDMTTNATPDQMKEAVGFRSIDTGLKHGTITFLVDSEPIETTTYRTDGTYSDGRHPDSIEFARTLEEDLARRDFTVNAMAWAPDTGVVDPFGGTHDLEDRLLRCVGDARERFSEDGLRVMRALRFAAVYGFDVEEETARAVHEKKWMLGAVSKERICTELTKMMAAPDGRHLADIVGEFCDVVFEVIPELVVTYDFDQENPYHDRDLWTHLLDTMAAVEPDPDLRLAALLHDIGKPSVKTKGDDGIAHYLGHAEAGAAIVEPLLRRLKFSRRAIDEVTFLVAQHDNWPSATKKSARRFLARCGDEPMARKVLALMKADRAAHAEKLSHRSIDSLDGVEEYLDAVLAENTAFSVKDLAVSGDDLLAMGWRESPALGAELARLFDLVLAGDVPNEREALLAEIGSSRGDTPAEA
ncbi:MAG: HD domain-containing protein [Coriobacteriia bacterium]|nr:HD domain-containing protein [Coriobacteriia bacterium]